MKTMLTVLVVLLGGLFCLSACSTTHGMGGGFLPPYGHHGLFLGAPMGNMFSGFTGLLVFSALVVAAALALRSILDRQRRRESGGADPRPPRPRSNIEMEELVRDLQHTAKRLEERLEALETILLEHGRHRH